MGHSSVEPHQWSSTRSHYQSCASRAHKAWNCPVTYRTVLSMTVPTDGTNVLAGSVIDVCCTFDSG